MCNKMFASVSNFKEPSLEIPSNSLDSQHQTETVDLTKMIYS